MARYLRGNFLGTSSLRDKVVFSDLRAGLILKIGGLTLSASWCLSRSGGEICQEMPRQLESREQGLVCLAWTIDNGTEGPPECSLCPPWLADGRQYRHLLPWERERATYAARPHCYVRRDWTRLALRKLSAQ